MRYQGGKSRIAGSIALVIERERESNNFVSLFCGSCAVEVKLVDSFSQVICNDNHKYLIALYKALQNGYEPPDYVDEEEYCIWNNIKKTGVINKNMIAREYKHGYDWEGVTKYEN